VFRDSRVPVRRGRQEQERKVPKVTRDLLAHRVTKVSREPVFRDHRDLALRASRDSRVTVYKD
jgi:hypothetical protein